MCYLPGTCVHQLKALQTLLCRAFLEVPLRRHAHGHWWLTQYSASPLSGGPGGGAKRCNLLITGNSSGNHLLSWDYLGLPAHPQHLLNIQNDTLPTLETPRVLAGLCLGGLRPSIRTKDAPITSIVQEMQGFRSSCARKWMKTKCIYRQFPI